MVHIINSPANPVKKSPAVICHAINNSTSVGLSYSIVYPFTVFAKNIF